jgi:hypothetical protein
MLPFLFAVSRSEVKYEYNHETGCFTVTTTDPKDVISNDYIAEMFPDGRNWTSLKVTGPVKNLSYAVFSGATECKSIEIPDTIEYIDSYVFSQNWEITEIKLPSSLIAVSPHAFLQCSSLKKVTYYKITTHFGREAFSLCHELESFVKATDDETTPIEGASFYLGAKCFYDCPMLSTIELPDGLTYIGDNCFNGASSLKSIKLPEGVTKITQSCFQGATALTDINLENIVTIGKNAFAGCVRLKKLTTSEKLRFINESAFESCSVLEDVTSLSKSVNFTFSKYCFQGCSNLKSIEIPSTMDEIPAYAFKYCSSLSKIEFKGDIYKIGKSAFYDTGFTEFHIPDSISLIEESAFVSMKKLTRFIISESNTQYGVDEDNFLYSKQNKEIIIYPQGNAQKIVVIPAKYDKIGYGAFAWCRQINTVKFEGNITQIGNQAFAHCTGLSNTITLPNGLICVNDECFLQCTGINKVIVQSPTASLAQACFMRCYNLVEIQIPPTLQNFGKECFKSCSSLKFINCSNANRFEEFVFSGCSSLQSVILPETCKAINIGLFSYCSSLETIKLSDDMTHIYAYAFNCAGLKTITIPEKCSRIDDHAFCGTKLEHIVFPVCIDEVSMNALSDTLYLKSVEFLGRVNQIGQDAFTNSSLKTMLFRYDIGSIAYSAFTNTHIENITYCGSEEVTGRAFQDVEPAPKVYVTEEYKAQTFAALTVTDKNKGYCPEVIPTPNPTEIDISHLSNKVKYGLIGGVCGLVIIVGLVVGFVVPCVMKRRGWAKKETLTESLLTQTV